MQKRGLARRSRASVSSVAVGSSDCRSGIGALLLAGLSIGVGLRGDVDQIRDLFVVEASQATEVAGQVDGTLVVLTAESTEAEQLVDGALELERILLALRIVDG